MMLSLIAQAAHELRQTACALVGCVVLLAFATAMPASATTINFEVQGDGAGGNLTGIPDSPLIIGIATFTGGELRAAEIGLNADQTAVYASEGLFGSGETNPVAITFAKPVRNFSVRVLNGGDAGSYTVSDDLGDSLTKFLASTEGLGGSVFSLPGDEVKTVDIASANVDAWKFAIDNVTFSSETPTPEPESLLLCGAGILLLAGARRVRSGSGR